jgi:hypothetical protein
MCIAHQILEELGDQFKEKDLLNNFEGLEEIPPLANEQMSRTSVI